MRPSHDDLGVEIARLKRRLERERGTRREAEAIAERGLRELYDKQQQLQLLAKMATAANRMAAVDEALQFAVVQIAEFMGWEVGQSYLVVGSGDTRRLRSTRIWHGTDPARVEAFRRASEDMDFGVGVGLPGRALAMKNPIFVEDVTVDGNFPRFRLALKCGLKSGSAFPVLSGDEVVAVLEFFSMAAHKLDEALLDLMSQIGVQFGRAIERQRSEDRLRERAAELEHARDEAQTADRAKSAFLANMSHELRTPLNAIIGFSEMMREEIKGPLDPVYRDYARDINHSGQHLLAVINDILDLSKVEVGRLQLCEDAVSVGDTIETCRRVVAPMAESAKVSLSINLPQALPVLRVDEVRFKQVLLNLLSNAVKFTPCGGRVNVSARIGAAGVTVAIADTGIGMKTEDIAVALKPFRQIDSALNRRYEGTGLGLPLAKALVELHGGQLDIRSTVGVGTTVSILLPPERIAGAAA